MLLALTCSRAPELVDGAGADDDLRPGESRSPFRCPAHQSKERRIGMAVSEPQHAPGSAFEPPGGRLLLAWVFCFLLVFGALLCSWDSVLVLVVFGS